MALLNQNEDVILLNQSKYLIPLPGVQELCLKYHKVTEVWDLSCKIPLTSTYRLSFRCLIAIKVFVMLGGGNHPGYEASLSVRSPTLLPLLAWSTHAMASPKERGQQPHEDLLFEDFLALMKLSTALGSDPKLGKEVFENVIAVVALLIVWFNEQTEETFRSWYAS
jgi:hypothetical protein